MNPLTLADLSRNAYRTLGLTAGATQADIDAAARKLRIWEDPASIPPTINDASWLGPLFRTKRDVEAAVARLAEPESRMEERLWWFCRQPPASDTRTAPGPRSAIAEHDDAIVHLYRTLILNSAQDNLDAWKSLLARFKSLSESDDYLAWMLKVENDGDFEKRASLDEIAGAQQRIPSRLTAALGSAVDEALDSEDFSAARTAVEVMRSAGASNSGTMIDDPAAKVLNRVEDLIAVRCDEWREKIHVAWNTREARVLRPACNRMQQAFPKDIQPLINEMVSLAPEDEDRVGRAKGHGVRLLVYAADAYEACSEFIAAELVLNHAVELAKRTPLYAVLQQRLEAASAASQRQRMGFSPRSQTNAAAGTQGTSRPFKVIGSGNRDYGGSWLSAFPKRGVFTLLFLTISFAARFALMDHSSSTSDVPGMPDNVPQNIQPIPLTLDPQGRLIPAPAGNHPAIARPQAGR